MFRYCPSCASLNVRFLENRKVYCPDCGLVYYHNTAAATGCIINAGGRVLLLERANDPAKGKLDLPGGFVEPGEGALEGLCREITEELGWDPALSGTPFEFLCSFPNTYPYGGFLYSTCDLFFTLDAPGLVPEALRPQAGEVAGIRFLCPEEVDPGVMAFASGRAALKMYAEKEKALRMPLRTFGTD